MKRGFGFFLAVICVALSSSGVLAEDNATLVLKNGRIQTVDESLGFVEAIAVSGHRIIALGDNEKIEPYIGPETRVIDLDGRFAMPGFIEGHGHFLSLGQSRQILDLSTARTWDDIVQQVSMAAQHVDPGEWILGRGWHQDKWINLPESSVEGVPRNDSLTAAAPQNPVLLGHASGHAAMANQAALARAGIGDLTADPAGGTIVRDAQGKATGLLRETAQRLVRSELAKDEATRSAAETESLMRERVRLAAEESLANGVTSFQDAGTSFSDIDFLRQMESEGALPVRLYVMVRFASNEEMAEKLPAYRMPYEDNDYLVVRSIKRQVDGALGAHGAWLLEPYVDLPDNNGLVLEPLDEIQQTAMLAIQHGFQLNTHAIGDRANREMLDLYAESFIAADRDGSDLRWRIEHAQHIDPRDVPRFAELGVIPAMQGVHATSDGPWLPSRLGRERTDATSYLWRDLIDSGAVMTNGTDVPVERIDPIASFYASVARKLPDGERLTPGQVMTRMEAIRSYTVNNAYAAFEENEKGSLAPGKLADIVVLSQDLMSVEEERIPETRVVMTLVGGEVRYEAAAD